MKVYALLSWYDEDPAHLSSCVRSLKGFADVLVALDGAYETFPDAQRMSAMKQRFALQDAAYASGVSYKITEPYRPWQGGEVEKRAALFELARNAGATANDWFLIIDADMCMGRFTPEAREKLAASDCDVAEVCWHDVQIDGKRVSTNRFRSLFRALPGLTVERAHYLYTVPVLSPDRAQCVRGHPGAPETGFPCCEGCTCTCGTEFPFSCECHAVACSRRFLWHLPDGHLSDEPICDLFGDVTLEHYNSSRQPERRQRALDYYKDRDARGLETVGDWR